MADIGWFDVMPSARPGYDEELEAKRIANQAALQDYLKRKAENEQYAAKTKMADESRKALSDFITSQSAAQDKYSAQRVDDAELAKEQAITANYGQLRGLPANQARSGLSAMEGGLGEIAKQTKLSETPEQPSGVDQYRSALGKLGQYSDNEAVKEYMNNLKSLSARDLSTTRLTDKDKIADLMDQLRNTTDPDEAKFLEQKIAVLQGFRYSDLALSGLKDQQGALLPGELKKFRAEEQIKTEEQGKREQAKSEISVEEAAKKAEAEKRLQSVMARPDTDAAIELIDDISTDQNLATGLNPKRLIASVPGTAEYYSKMKVQNLLDKLVLIERGKLKGQGPITDKEQDMLKNAVSVLSTNLSKEDFDEELAKIRSVVDASRRRWQMEQQTRPEPSKPVSTPKKDEDNDPLGIR